MQGAGDRAFGAPAATFAWCSSPCWLRRCRARFLAQEYRLNAPIGLILKPYIALMHGFVLGGGAGVSVHGRLRLADPGMSFAMPETAIGFVPDIGSSHFLARCPGRLGLYLGLTGTRIGAGDAMAAGLVDMIVSRTDFPALLERLAAGEEPEAAARAFAGKPPPQALAGHRRRIDTVFAAPSVEAILERLDRDGSEFALDTAALLRARSPSSLKLVFRQLQAAPGMSLRECLTMEYRLALRVITRHDFVEGVRAALVDKDRNPHWRPAALAAVPEQDIEAAFAPLARDLFAD
ncbi:MAG: enoyl-CoA hydratase/isomerase family protein [Alphaproteobacteria bacterium]|nr:enoyl-CoA hydratase/isomerase family protein [Alphaproteobacteria bacterium]